MLACDLQVFCKKRVFFICIGINVFPLESKRSALTSKFKSSNNLRFELRYAGVAATGKINCDICYNLPPKRKKSTHTMPRKTKRAAASSEKTEVVKRLKITNNRKVLSSCPTITYVYI